MLVYAHREECPLHREAVTRLRRLAEGVAAWGIPSICIGEFVRVITHPRIFDPPHTVEEARATLEQLLRAPSLRVILPGSRFISLLLETMVEGHATGNLIFDAMIVAICREAGVSSLLTEDRDFGRFKSFPTERLV